MSATMNLAVAPNLAVACPMASPEISTAVTAYPSPANRAASWPVPQPSSKMVRTPAFRSGTRNGAVHTPAQSRSSPRSRRCRKNRSQNSAPA
jgi:hypothetical protein